MEDTGLASRLDQLVVVGDRRPGGPAIRAGGPSAAVFVVIGAHIHHERAVPVRKFDDLAFIHLGSNRFTPSPGFAVIVTNQQMGAESEFPVVRTAGLVVAVVGRYDQSTAVFPLLRNKFLDEISGLAKMGINVQHESGEVI